MYTIETLQHKEKNQIVLKHCATVENVYNTLVLS